MALPIDIIEQLKNILAAHPQLKQDLIFQIAVHKQQNPNRKTNPVQSLEDLYNYALRFLTCLPYEGILVSDNDQLFGRVDQSIGYFYYIFGSLKTEPHIAQWLTDYDTQWGNFLNSESSWNNETLILAQSDSLFGLKENRYEDASNWHCWNDFFTRHLAKPHPTNPFDESSFLSPADGMITEARLKTATIKNWSDILTGCPYKQCFEDGTTFHIVLDMYDYHRFHSPISGTIIDHRLIDGVHHAGGTIIWDKKQGRYRYDAIGDKTFQMIEKRGIVIIDNPYWGKVAVVPVGVAQVSSVNFSFSGKHILAGDELGYFSCGGSDIVLFFEQDAPTANLNLPIKSQLKVFQPFA